MVIKMTKAATRARGWKKTFMAATPACMAVAYLGYFLFIGHNPAISLWLTPDQQGRYYFERGDYRKASERFQDPLWKGIACYRDGNFGAAIEQFAEADTPQGYFNLGNAYAHAGKPEQAIASYEEVLRRQPDNKEARENRDLVRSMVRKKKGMKKDDEERQEQEPTYAPDQIRFDEKGKKGSRGEVAQTELTTEQIQDLWMRRLQTTPSEFLRMKFAAQVEESKKQKRPGGPGGGT